MKILKVAVLALAAFSAVAVSANDANACGMSVRLDPTPQKPTPVQEIAKAEKSLENGNNLAAAQAVLSSFPRIRNAQAGANPLETRALRVFALAVVRSDGQVNEKKAGVFSNAEWTTNANLEWAAQAMREIDAKRPNDPTVQADLGEALSKLPANKAEAMTLLSKLAEKYLMGSPHAYAALAKMKGEKGDTAGALAAIKKCEEMSKNSTICRTPAKA